MTLLIVAILSVFVIARLDTSGFDQRAYHDKLKAGLQFARKAAVAERRYVCVTVAGSVVSFTFDPRPPEDASPVTCSTSLDLPSPDKSCAGTNQICPPSGVVLLAGTSLTFDARGGASAAVTFSSTGQPDITVENETGYVH